MIEYLHSTKAWEVLGDPPPLLHFHRPSGHLLGIGDGFPNTSSVLMEHGYNTDCCMIMPVTVLFNTSCSVVCDNSGLSRGKVSPRRTHAAEMLKETKRLLSIMMAAHKKSHLVYAGFFQSPSGGFISGLAKYL